VGQVIDVKVQLTANHLGYFVFRVCPVTDENREVTQQCLNKHELKVHGTNSPKYRLLKAKTGIFTVRVKLPNGLSCGSRTLDRQPLDRHPLDRQPLDRQPLDRQINF
jgi:hypothetical protein